MLFLSRGHSVAWETKGLFAGFKISFELVTYCCAKLHIATNCTSLFFPFRKPYVQMHTRYVMTGGFPMGTSIHESILLSTGIVAKLIRHRRLRSSPNATNLTAEHVKH